MANRLNGYFQVSKFDPVLLISQIIAQQSFLYFTLCLLLSVFLKLFEENFNLSLFAIFDFRQIHVSSSEGRVIISCFLVNSLIGAIFLWYFVKRRKMCLDFCCTFHLIHFLICLFFDGIEFPSLSFWLLNITCAVVMCVSAEYLCLREEMKEIPLYVPLSTKADL